MMLLLLLAEVLVAQKLEAKCARFWSVNKSRFLHSAAAVAAAIDRSRLLIRLRVLPWLEREARVFSCIIRPGKSDLPGEICVRGYFLRKQWNMIGLK